MARLPKQINTKPLEQKLKTWLYTRMDNDRKYTIVEYERMLRLDPVAGVANAALKQGTIAMLGQYTIALEDEALALEIQEYVQSLLASMKGSTEAFWQLCLSYPSHGVAIAHIKHKILQGQAWVDKFTFISPEEVRWKTENREITGIRVAGVSKDIPYEHVFHLMNEPDLTPGKLNPRGNAVSERAYKYWELEDLLFTTVGTIGQKQSSKLLIGKVPDTDAEVEIENLSDPDNPLITTSGEVMRDVLESTDDQSVVVCEVGDVVEAVDQTITGEFFDFILHDLRTQRFMSFYQPQTIFSGNKSGVGDAGLADPQKDTFLMFQEIKATHLGMEFVEQVLRPLIEFNFGVQPSYGFFKINKQDPKALQIAGLVLQLLTSGILGGGQNQDGSERELNKAEWEAAYNKLKELVGM